MRALVAGVVLTLVAAAPAFGHATLDVKTAEAGTNVELAVAVPDEEEVPGIVTTKVVIEAPEQFSMIDCTGEAPWTCNVTEERIATFERPAAGASDGDKPELRIEVRTASTAGRYPFEVNQFYSSGEVVNWDGPPDSDHPAPVFEVTGSAAAPEVTAGPEPTTEVTIESATTTSAGESPTEESEPTSDNDFPWWLVILAGAVLLVGVAAVAISRRAR